MRQIGIPVPSDSIKNPADNYGPCVNGAAEVKGVELGLKIVVMVCCRSVFGATW